MDEKIMHDPQSDTPTAACVVAGIDVGGTFTDLILINQRADHATAQQVMIAKCPTTTDNQAYGVVDALSVTNVALSDIDLIVHGTTTTTNAMIERRMARTGLITTAGFRDVLELGRRTRPQPYGMTGTFSPVISRDLRLEVNERMEASGQVRIPLDEKQLRAALQTLIAAGCESLVIHFLHAYANPAHEIRAAEIAAELWPNEHITMGHALLSEAREYERGVTAAVNASVQPILKRYVERLRIELKTRGYGRDFLMMNGNGGMISARLVTREAAKTVMSGPASGVMAAAYTARQAGFSNIVTYDMGGTSSDVALIRDGQAAVSNEIEIDYAMPIHVPMVDVHTIGAGGGSIARLDASGLIQVGPDSAGADPGPICYARGGREPTISDAHVLLGRLGLKRLNAVDHPVSINLIKTAFMDRIGHGSGLDAQQAAGAVIRLANLKMAGAIRMVSLAKGHDPRDFALFAFGGAGPLHASALARELAIPTVIVPARPGITNALGCVVADLRHDFVKTINRPLSEMTSRDVSAILEEQRQRGMAMLEEEAVKPATVRTVHSADMQFAGQTHLITVALPSRMIAIADLQALFEKAYFDRFRVRLPEIRAQLVNLSTSVIGERPLIDLAMLIDPQSRARNLADALIETRPVWFDDTWLDTPVYERTRLPLQASIDGPAILEQLDATTVIEPGDHALSDPAGNIVITVAPRKTD